MALALTAIAAACGDDAEERPGIISAGQVDIQLPPGWEVTEQGASRPAAAAAAEAGAEGDGEAAAPGSEAPTAADAATEDTVPLAEQDPSTAFFQAAAGFQTCLGEHGTTFMGLPNPNDASSPTNDPSYIEALQTCAAKTNIVQALENVQAAEAAMTPEEIKASNEGYLRWRDCMIERGWGVPEPKPDSEGRLFSIGGAATGGGGPQIEAPPGKDLLTSPDLGECGEEAFQEGED
ncbi:MAG TPA: hypothetical protein VEA78_13800 [Acidimicrobiales bacterium]|nr:hypothetical protein [Acidimicrobiales bacterium]